MDFGCSRPGNKSSKHPTSASPPSHRHRNPNSTHQLQLQQPFTTTLWLVHLARQWPNFHQQPHQPIPEHTSRHLSCHRTPWPLSNLQNSNIHSTNSYLHPISTTYNISVHLHRPYHIHPGPLTPQQPQSRHYLTTSKLPNRSQYHPSPRTQSRYTSTSHPYSYKNEPRSYTSDIGYHQQHNTVY